MDTLDDLLSKRRRGALSEAEERRLRVAVQSSSEYELSLVAGDAFDREGLPAPGDSELIESIVKQHGAGALVKLPRLGRRRPAVLWAAVPVFLAGAAAASYGGYRASVAARAQASAAPSVLAPRARASGVAVRDDTSALAEAPVAPAEPTDELYMAPLPQALGLAGSRPVGASTSGQLAAQAEPEAEPARSTVVEPARRAAKRPPENKLQAQVDESLADADQSLANAEHEPLANAEHEPLANAEHESLANAEHESLANAEHESLAKREHESAGALFRRANRLRSEDWLAAASVYAHLIDRHPSSHQAGIAEMALGKRALSEGRWSEALRWFRAHQRRPESALGAEALWGEAQALERLNRASEARRPWRALLQRHPTSTYASVARQRLTQP